MKNLDLQGLIEAFDLRDTRLLHRPFGFVLLVKDPSTGTLWAGRGESVADAVEQARVGLTRRLLS